MKKFSGSAADELIYELATRDAERSSGDLSDESRAPLRFPWAPVDVVDWRERAVRRFAEHLVRKTFSTPSA